LIDEDKNTPWFKDYFHNQQHVSYWAEADKRLGPVLVFLKLVDNDLIMEHTSKQMALVRTKFDDEWVFIPFSQKPQKKILAKAIEQQCRNGDKMQNLKLHKIESSDGPKDILDVEQKLLTRAYKFGVLYSKGNQTEEDDMFGNTETSSDFEEFLNLLGERVVLQGWQGYRGGLDVKNNSTGTHSVYTKHNNYEIMFHVSTMLPYFAADKQQLERKRHLGNDVCVIVFRDGDESFAPDTIKSEFNHVFAVVTPDRTSTSPHYKVAFAYKGGVGMSQPLLPSPASFPRNKFFRDLLLTKLINSERGAMYAPSFVNKVARTKELQIQALIDKWKESS